MNNRRLLLILATLLFAVNGLQAQEVKECYGLCTSQDNLDGTGIYAFDFDGQQVTNLRKAHALSSDRLAGAACVDGIYYWTDISHSLKGYLTNGLYAYDMEERTVRQIANYNGTLNGDIVSHLAYDYTTRTMYGLWGSQSGHYLAKIDLETGEQTRLEHFSMDEYPPVADNYEDRSFITDMISLACNYDGDLYGLSYWGGLYRINKVTAECTYIGELSKKPEDAFMYNNNCLFFDNDTEKLYFRVYNFDWDTYRATGVGGGIIGLWEIDTETAKVTVLQEWPYNSSTYDTAFQLDGIYVPFQPAEASAPAKV